MILYFSGTGNSRYIADILGSQLHQDVVNLNAYMKKKEVLSIEKNETLIFVSPTYGWQLPHVVKELIEKSTFHKNQVYFVLTCGGDIANARETIETLCIKKQLVLKGVLEVVMPENYIAMFSVPSIEQSQDIIDKALQDLQQYIPYFQEERDLPIKKVTTTDYLKSGIVNKMFYRFFVKDKAFYATDECISCGKCAEVCVLNNISIVDGKPKWNSHCTHCMACICQCPKEAIEYGQKSIGKRRYQCVVHK